MNEIWGFQILKLMVYSRKQPSIFLGQLKLCSRNLGPEDSPAWPCKFTVSSGRSGGWGAAGWTGASSVRGTAVSRRGSGMWLGSGGRHTQRDLLCFAIMQQAQRTSTEYIISCPSSSPLCRATERTLVRPVTNSLNTAFPKSKNPHTGYTPIYYWGKCQWNLKTKTSYTRTKGWM